MSFRKFVSAFSALTIAVTAFAGLAVTANADSEIYTRSFSSADADSDGNVTATDISAVGDSTTITYATDSDNSINYLHIVAPRSTRKSTAGMKLTNSLDKSTGVYDISYKLRISSFAAANNGLGLLGSDNYIVGAVSSSSSNKPRWGYGKVNDNSATTIGDIAWTADTWYKVTERVSLTAGKVTGLTVTALDDSAVCSATYTTETGFDASALTALQFVDGGQYYATTTDVTFDIADISITSIDATAATSIDVKYVDSSDSTKVLYTDSEETPSSYIVGGSYTYAYPAYYIYTDATTGKKTLYKADTDTYQTTAKIESATSTYTVKYTAQDDTVFEYYEGDGAAPYTSTSSFSNASINNMADGTSTAVLDMITVPENGVYKLTVHAGATRGYSTANAAIIFVNGTAQDVTMAMNGGLVTADYELTLSKGDVIAAGANNTRVCIDYALLTKTGVTATNIGTFTADDGYSGDEGQVATAFSAELGNVTGTLSFTVTPSDTTQEAKTFDSAVTVANANVVLGIIVQGLSDASATGVLTVE